MDLGIQGKSALVFGAAGGLGSAIARTLAKEGASVILADIDASGLDTVARDISQAGGRATTMHWDISDAPTSDRHLETLARQLPPVEILVNNTGGPPPTPALGQPPEMWMKHFESMVLSVIRITDSLLPRMIDGGWGRIITSTSSGVVAPIPALAMSNALRLSLVGWSKTLAGEIGCHGVTANIVLPGRIATPRITALDAAKAQRTGRDVKDVARDSAASIPVGRYGQPDEYAAAVAFLASTQASYITGSILRVDGGLIPSL